MKSISCTWQLKSLGPRDSHHSVQILLVSLSQELNVGSQNATSSDSVHITTLSADHRTQHQAPAGTARSSLHKAAKVCLDSARVVHVAFCVPCDTGFLIRGDVFERRLEGCSLVESATSFVEFNHPVKLPFLNELLDLLDCSLAGFQLKNVASSYTWKQLQDVVHHEFASRLNFNMLSPNPLARKRLIWVEGRADIEVSRRIWEGAQALGISIVLIDNPGHWLQSADGPFSRLREDFIPMNIAVDEGFADRLIETVQDYSRNVQIDGIMTISDARLIGVAKACEVLGYPTAPSSAYALAGDKYKTRALEPSGSQSILIKSMDDLKKHIAEPQQNGTTLQYPLIVKPCFGWGSECVAKVTNGEDLVAAAEKASARHAQSPQRRSDIMIEPYIDGPEVDANIALLDGNIVFYEVADDFPSLGDADGSQLDDNFQETANLLPTALPAEEHALIRDSLAKSLRRMGFTHGAFHCEGRVRNSRMKYARSKAADMSWDLVPNQDFDASSGQSFFLHEINARPAGYLESVATMLTYGVDYYALQMLLALGEAERFSQLAISFESGAQWHLALLLIPEEKAGIMKTPDATLGLMERHSDLAAAIVDHNTVIKGGSRCYGPKASQLNYLAYISVVSRESRNECLRLSEKVRREFQYDLVEDH